MQMMIHRRKFMTITASAIGFLAAPPIMRAASFDAGVAPRGWNLDPLVLAFRENDDGGEWVASLLPHAKAPSHLFPAPTEYGLVRLSEVNTGKDVHPEVSIRLPLAVHQRTLRDVLRIQNDRIYSDL